MSMNKLIEFKNKEEEVLRGIFSDKGSSEVVLCIHGFERTATAEPKSKRLSDELSEKNISSFRFDFSGCGLSDGDFKDMTVEKLVEDLKSATENIKKEASKVSVVAHSLAGCVLARFKNKYPDIVFEKIVLISPAFNQKELLRYYFAVSLAKKEDKNIVLNWENWADYFSGEDDFQKSYMSDDKFSKSNYFPKKYFQENKELDYSSYFSGDEKNILHIHGTKDSAVPIESLNIKFKNSLIVEGGDHDLEIPTMQNQWLKKAVNFLAERKLVK